MNKFVIPHCSFPTLNEYIYAERKNRFIAAKMKKDATDQIWLFAKNLELDQAKQYDVKLSFYTKDKRKDSDGVNFAVKFILDGIIDKKEKTGEIVRRGKLPNDSYRYIRHIFNYRYIGHERIEVEFIPVEGVLDVL